MLARDDDHGHTVAQPIQLRCRDAGIVIDGYEDDNTITVHYTVGNPEMITRASNRVFHATQGKTIEKIEFNDGNEVLVGRLVDAGFIGLKFDEDSKLVHRLHVDGYSPIDTYAEFQLINTATSALAKKYKQEANLDLMDKTWIPVGISSAQPFTGFFNGAGHTIARVKRITEDSEELGSIVGLFGYIRQAEIRNVGVISGEVAGRAHVGAICGVAYSSRIIACYNKGAKVTAYNRAAGGVCGYGPENAEIIACYNTGEVNGLNNVGGVIGDARGTVTACYNTGNVNGTGGSVGGVVGVEIGGALTACYNIGIVTGGNTYVGGVCGNRDSGSTITACYWLHRTGTNYPAYGVGNPASDTNAAKFSGNNGGWPTPSTTGWNTTNPGINGNYWSDLGGWNIGGVRKYPKLFFE
jgi:hypothetical protein